MKKYILSLVILLAASNSFSENLGNKIKTNVPVNIESDSLIYDTKAGAAVFSGNVKVTQDDMAISAEKMNVYSDEKSTKKTKDTGAVNTNFKRIEAFGNVSFSGKNISGKSQEAIYEIFGEVLTLKGSVYLNQNGNELYGEKFVYNMKTGKYDVYSTKNEIGTTTQSLNSEIKDAPKGRVRLVLTPEKTDLVRKKGEQEIKTKE